MKEVRDLASTMRDMLESLKRTSADAQSEFKAEVDRAHVNTQKLRSFTNDLKSANQEVEGLLSTTNSNFPDPEPSEPQETSPKTDHNGVTMLKDMK